MSTSSARRTVIAAGIGFLVTTILLQFVPHDPFAEMPKLALVDYPLDVTEDLSTTRAPDELRIFVVGASVETGYPYLPEYSASYATQLEVGLSALFPDKKVVCRPAAQPAVASPSMVEVVEEVLKFDPSLVFVCLGENEFADRLFYGSELVPSAALEAVSERCTRSRLLFQGLARAIDPQPEKSEFEVQQAILDLGVNARPGRPSLGALPVSAEDQELILERMADSLRAISVACAAKEVPLMFGLAAHNYVGHGPFATAGAVRDRCVQDALFGSLDRQAAEAAVRELPERADRWFALGHARLLDGDGRGAREAFVKSVDFDVAPMHLTSDLVARLEREAKSLGRPLVDLGDALVDPAQPVSAVARLPDPRHFLDHAHLTVEAHLLAASFLAERFAAEGFVPTLPDGWRSRFESAATRHTSAEIDAVGRQRSVRVVSFADATFYMLFGNFTDALSRWVAAFEAGSKGDLRSDANLTFCLLFCVDGINGKLDEVSSMTGRERGAETEARYAALRAALERGELRAHVRSMVQARVPD